MSLNIRRETLRDELAWLASHHGKQVKTGGITLSHIHCPPVNGVRKYRSGEFVGVVDADTGLWGRYAPQAATHAQITTDTGVDNAGLVWTTRGAGNNAVTIELDDPTGADQDLAVTVVANAITVSLATDSGGDLITTAQEVIDAIRADADADALVHVELMRGHDGTGLVTDSGGAEDLDNAVAASGTQASLTTGDIDAVADTSIVYTAIAPGTDGNNIQVEYVIDGTNTPLSIELHGAGTTISPYIITVNLETGSGGAAVSTAAEIIDAVNAHYYTRNLVTAVDADGDAGVPLIAYGPEPLAGGAAPNVSLDEEEFGILINDVDVTHGNAIGAILYAGRVLDARLPAASDALVRAALPLVRFSTENAP